MACSLAVILNTVSVTLTLTTSVTGGDPRPAFTLSHYISVEEGGQRVELRAVLFVAKREKRQ